MLENQPSRRLLKEIFTRNAYIRAPNKKKRTKFGRTKYKKGYEVRFSVNTTEELEVLRQLLVKAQFSPAKPFQKHKQIVQPIYGKQAVEYFLAVRGLPWPRPRRRKKRPSG